MSNTTTKPLGQDTITPRDLLEAVMLEDGVDAAIELASHPELVPGANPATIQLLIAQLLAHNVFERLNSDDPFTVDAAGDKFFTQDDLAGLEHADQNSDEDHWVEQTRQFEESIRVAHSVMNTAGAVRAVSISQYARWDAQDVTCTRFAQHEPGHVGEFTADGVAAELRLSSIAASQLVRKSVWAATKTPALLGDAASGVANLDTVTAVATELQDARPDTCELIEDTILQRKIHCRGAASARRSTRTLVTRFEAAAARKTHKRTKAQQTGVWFDPHPTPGLASFTAVLPDAQVAEICDLVDKRAYDLKRSDTSEDAADKLLGEYRADALYEIVTRNLNYTLDIQILTPTTCTRCTTNPADADDSDGGNDDTTGDDNPGGGSGPAGPGSSGGQPGTSSRTTRKAVTRGEALGLFTGKSSGTNSTAMAIHHRAGALSGYGIEALIQNATTITTTGVEFNPHTGELIHQDTSQAYRPPDTMRRRIQARDQHCRAPGCARHAVFTDTDHVTAYQRGGPTTDTNLQCLCRHHHKMKQRGWHVTMNTAGVCTWTSPTGRTYTTEPGLLQTYWDTEGP
ncbi:hypothetical protein GCM10027599_13810 [Yimella radicis]